MRIAAMPKMVLSVASRTVSILPLLLGATAGAATSAVGDELVVEAVGADVGLIWCMLALRSPYGFRPQLLLSAYTPFIYTPHLLSMTGSPTQHGAVWSQLALPTLETARCRQITTHVLAAPMTMARA